MSEMRLSLEPEPSSEDLETLERGLMDAAVGRVAARDYRALTLLLRDWKGRVRAGLRGATVWKWLHIKHLWVDESLRSQGYGRRLVEAAEREAVRRGCVGAWVDTFSFQSPEFYEHLGYEAFAELEEFPPGQKRFFFKKTDLDKKLPVEAP